MDRKWNKSTQKTNRKWTNMDQTWTENRSKIERKQSGKGLKKDWEWTENWPKKNLKNSNEKFEFPAISYYVSCCPNLTIKVRMSYFLHKSCKIWRFFCGFTFTESWPRIDMPQSSQLAVNTSSLETRLAKVMWKISIIANNVLNILIDVSLSLSLSQEQHHKNDKRLYTLMH